MTVASGRSPTCPRRAGAARRAAAGTLPVSGAALDSRPLGAGRAVRAAAGARADGHAFLAEALGAAAPARPLCAPRRRRRRVPRRRASGGPLVAVDDAERRAAAAGARARRDGVAGPAGAASPAASGKTTTKELLAAVLASARRPARTEGNLNNQLGVPRHAPARCAADHRFAVVEIGMNHPGEIARRWRRWRARRRR